MAYVSPELKAKLAPAIKALCKQYGLKGTLSVRSHSALVLTISSGSIDFISNFNDCANVRAKMTGDRLHQAKDHIDVNLYHFNQQFAGRALEFISKVEPLLKGPDFFDHSDSQTDYFHRSHYIGLNIGRWDKPYKVV